MFHTFQTLSKASAGTDALDGGKSKSPNSRRISTSNACVECRRRKIRCDGLKPCGQCQWYQHPELCNYHKPAQRVVPSRKLVEKLTGQVEQHKAVLNRLIPKRSVESLATSSREELLELVLTANTQAASPTASQPPTLAHTESVSRSDGAESLEALEEAPEESPEWDEAKKHRGKVQVVSDDINGLSMSVDRLSSYVGISSIPAALKVIVKNAPYASSCINCDPSETLVPSQASTPPPDDSETRSPTALPKPEVGQRLIESYFEKVHTFFPMIDERKFWTTYIYGERKDAPWFALLNMIFALGSLGSSTSDSEAHTVYFTRARHHLSLESFGSGNLEVLQAMGMMSGYYMHYLNRPNEAHALMGGTLRMATSLGLHREYIEPPQQPPTSAGSSSRTFFSDAVSGEMRRRIWWSLFCLDTWASTTSGRPSLGRMGPSITTMYPGKLIDQYIMAPQSSQNQMNEAMKILPLIHFSEFCKIATKIQDRLIEQPLMKAEELNQLDAETVQWYEDLPSILLNLDEECPEFMRVPRAVMKWRYQNLRIVLHRPILLSTALRRVPFSLLSAEEKVAVGKCRIIAAKTIEDISAECTNDLLSGWNGVWFCYQACMIPLVSMFSDQSNGEELGKWRSLLEMATEFFERMRHYSIAARSSGDLVTRLLDAFSTAQEEGAAEAAKLEALQQQQKPREDIIRQRQRQGSEEEQVQEQVKQEEEEERARQEHTRLEEQQQQLKQKQMQYHRQQHQAHQTHQRRLSQQYQQQQQQQHHQQHQHQHQQHQQPQKHHQRQAQHQQQKRRLSEQYNPQRQQPPPLLHQITPPPQLSGHQQHHHHLQHQSQQLHPDYVPFTTVDGFVSAISSAATPLGALAATADLATWPDPSGMGSLSGVWDEMMWDTNLPDMNDTLYYSAAEFDYAQTAPDGGPPQSWAFGQ